MTNRQDREVAAEAQPVPHSLPKEPGARLDWPDIARGLSILGVVLLHVTLAVPEGGSTLIAELNHFLDPLRMPLFFLVSGFFSVKVLNQSFARLFTTRLWFFLVPYAIWAPIELYSHYVEVDLHAGHPPMPLQFYVSAIINGGTMYWFLHALVCFNLVLWLTRRLPRWAIVLVALSPMLLMPAFSDHLLVRRMVIYLPVFLIGVYLRPQIARFAEMAARPRTVVTVVALYVAGMAVSTLWALFAHRTPGEGQLWLIDLKDDIAAFLGGELTPFDLGHIQSLLVYLLSVPAGIVVSVLLARIGPVARGLKFFGRHTLPIYLGHALGINIIFGWFIRYRFMEIDNTSPNPLHWTQTWMAVVFLLAMLGAGIVYVISRIPVLGWIVVPPRLTGPTRPAAVTAPVADPARGRTGALDPPRT
ncbi:acyltransferase family protein [Corynebacterium pacaense]|uniref:acyltransferase family protein n=1 Tax=Corynebacterium pacaense TaxID=1816684 RepID=UPI0009BBEEE8|nr:acyltransferase family protein [Corynebacterium pacaense]